MGTARQFPGKAAAAALASTAALLAAAPAPAEAADRPNILVIMADDLSPWALGAYGNTDHATPHIDRLAREGVMFRTAYCTPVCGPTRVLIMTGKYGHQTLHWNMGDRPGAPKTHDPPLDFIDDHKTFGNYLSDMGYRTTIAGKWQLVTPMGERIPAAGFHTHLMWRIGSREGFGMIERNAGGVGNAGSRYFHPSLTKDGVPWPSEPDQFGPDLFVDHLLETITADADSPWFAYYPMVLPHGPLGPTPDHPDLPYGSSPETFRAFVEYMDKMVGRLVDAIDETGQADNTLIIFTTDNGTDGGFQKNTPSEAGAHVPLIVRWPGVAPAGHVSDALVDFTDLFMTVLDAAGAVPDEGLHYYGMSMLPYFRGEVGDMREWIFSYLGQFRILRTRNWLLEYESPDYRGDFYFTGENRGGLHEYLEVTHYDHPKVLEARARFDEILAELPPPDLPASERMRFIRYLENYNGPGYDIRRAYPAEYREREGALAGGNR